MSPRVLRKGWVGVAVAGALVVAGCASGQTQTATSISSSGATLNGAVSSVADGDVAYWFNYGVRTTYGQQTQHRTLHISDRDTHPVSETVGDLWPGTTYHFQLCAQYPGFDPSCGTDETLRTRGGLTIDVQPALYPGFAPAVSDYVTRCTGDPVTVTVAAPLGTKVGIDGSAPQSGRFSQDVSLAAGQRFDFSTTKNGTTSTYHVRCLPADFPDWTYSRTKPSHLDYEVVTPSLNGQLGTTNYLAFFDTNGVPVWWYKADHVPVDATLMPDNTVAFGRGFGGFGTDPASAFEIRRLDGSLVRKLQTVGGVTDFHDMQLLLNGDYLLDSYVPRNHVDLSAFGGPSDATVLDAEIQEITPDGSVVWSWNSKDHIALSETDGWWPTVLSTPTTLSDGRKAYDIVHLNAYEPDGGSLLISLRHTDALYRIDRSDGHVQWKLGGTATPESLAVSGDNRASLFGGQHDVRRLSDGTVSVHDNGTRQGRPPRVLRFQIDPTAKTATVVEKVTDPTIDSSGCCGSARRLPGGGWLVDWGGNPTIGEYAADGTRVSKLTFAKYFSYRAFPVTGGQVSASALRQGMDAMFPR